MVTTIDPAAIKRTGETRGQSNVRDFSVFMNSFGPTAYQADEGGNLGVTTQAAMTGMSNASTGSYNSPYMTGPGGALMSTSSHIPGHINYGDGGVPATGFGGSAGATGASGTQFQGEADDFVQKEQLFRTMHDSMMNMLVIQAQVQDQNRQFTLVSNMMQSRDQAMKNMIQNMRGG